MKKIFLFLFMISHVNLLYAEKLDSLENVRKTGKDDTLKVNALGELTYYYLSYGEYEKSLIYAEESRLLSEKLHYKRGLGNYYNNLGLYYFYTSDYPKALELGLKSLKIAQELNDKRGIFNSYGNLGNIYSEMKAGDKALFYYKEGLKQAELNKNKIDIASCYINLGVEYGNQGKHLESLEYYLKGTAIFEESGNKLAIGTCYNNIGNSFAELGRFKEALPYFEKSLAIKLEIHDWEGASTTYANIANLNKELKNYPIAVKNGKEGIRIAKEIKNLDNLRFGYEVMSDVYERMKNFEEAYRYHKEFKLITDSIFNVENSQQMGDLKTNFEVEKKAVELNAKAKAEKEKLIAIALEEKKRQQTVIYSGIFILIIVLIFSGVLYQRYKLTQKQKGIIEEQKIIVEEKNTEITDSINYARRIQHALLPAEETISAFFPEHFVLFKPKDIVSGDFYWCSTSPINHHFIYFAAADCTGHGVPGGFMSMLGMTYLNDIVNEKALTETNEILDLLRENIKNALNKGLKEGENKRRDGMDISLARINKTTMELQVSAANNSFYIIRNGNELIEIKSDKQPVGAYEWERPFSVHTLKLQAGDMLYSFTDGYSDQFGGPNGKKFMNKQFKAMLLEHSKEKMPAQKIVYNKILEDWKSNKNIHGNSYHQIDDITIFGIRI